MTSEGDGGQIAWSLCSTWGLGTRGKSPIQRGWEKCPHVHSPKAAPWEGCRGRHPCVNDWDVVDGLALLGTRISAVEGLCCPEHLRNVLNVVPPPARPRVARAGSAREQFHPVPMTALRQSTVGAMALHPEWPDLPRLVYATPRE